MKVKGGIAVYQDMQKKSFVIQDIDPQDDPNISGGTTFLIGLYIEPTQYGDNRITQDGWIRLEFVDDTDTPLLDVNGNPMAVQIDYKAGDEQRKELYLGECQSKAYTDVHLRIETNFPNEELLSIGANSCVLIQSVGKDYGVGKALLAFMAFTGYQVKMNNKYYGYNSLNLARTLIFPEPETEINNDVTYMGDNTYLSVKTAAKVSISNNQLIVKDNNKDLPVFSLFKRYNRFDTFVCRGKNYKATVKITDKQNAFVVALMKYTGSENVAPTPELVSYNNDQPQFNAGWSISDKLFISEDAVSGIHEATKTILVIVVLQGYAEAKEKHIKNLNGVMKQKVIILDGGHGVDCAGKRSPIWGDGSQLLEWEFNRDIVRRIAAMLKAEGIKFEILVPEDNDVSLPERCRRANVIHADCGNNAVLFSVHGNAGGGTGWECYTSVGQTKADAIATVLCEEAEKEFAPDGWKMRFDYIDGDPDKESQFYILKHTVCPAVLSENFFMDTEKDCRFMMTDAGRERIAKVHYNTIKRIL